MTCFSYIKDYFVSVWAYRAYLKQSVKRDLKKRYKRSILGYCWSMLHPLAMMCILAVVFSQVFRVETKSYAVFVFAGMLPYNFFSGTVQGCLGVISANLNLMEQVPIPKYIFPTSIVISNLINLILSLLPLFLVMLFAGTGIHWTIILTPIILFPLFMITVGIALLFACANVFFDDTSHLTGIILQALYFLCPILYGAEHLPANLVQYLKFNPLWLLIEFMRDIYYNGVVPNLLEFLFCFIVCALILNLGVWVFKRTEDRFIYFI